jgi:hypothetical protein
MDVKKHFLSTIVLTVLFVGFTGMTALATEPGLVPDSNSIADVAVGPNGLNWLMKVSYAELVLNVSKPDGSIFQKAFKSGSTPALEVASDFMDGYYTYELRVIPEAGKKMRQGIEMNLPQETMMQSGSFLVQGGIIVTGGPEQIAAPMDVLHYDDVIITGSLCVGFDCANGESFGYCTVKLKENNLQLCFEDTSIGTFPTNDWKIQINDTTSGGASYFTLWDTDGGRRPFTIEAGAPAHSLYVEDYGRVGLGTSIPYVELHIVDGDSPTVRLDQDGSSGWTAQRWDLCGNETNFFIRDVTNGSKLCFRIQPNTPSNTLCLKADGKVGIGTWSPAAQFEIETTGENAAVLFQRTDGATGKFTARPSEVFIGSDSNHNVRIVANNNQVMTVEPGGDVGIGNTNPTHLLDVGTSGAYCDGGGWVDGSSIEYKENVRTLTGAEAMATLAGLSPVKFNYKVDKTEEWVGFIAEDVPDLVATKDRKGMSPMDVVAVLTKVVQEQQKTIDELKAKIAEIDQK